MRVGLQLSPDTGNAATVFLNPFCKIKSLCNKLVAGVCLAVIGEQFFNGKITIELAGAVNGYPLRNSR